MRRLRVLVAEDQYLMREGIRRILAEQPDMEIVGVAADYDSVIDGARRQRSSGVIGRAVIPDNRPRSGPRHSRHRPGSQ